MTDRSRLDHCGWTGTRGSPPACSGGLAAAAALLQVGDTPAIEGLDAVEHAAWTNLSTVLLSLPQTVTRG